MRTHMFTYSLFIVFTATLRMESSWLSWPSITAPNSPVAEEGRHWPHQDPMGTVFPPVGWELGREESQGSGGSCVWCVRDSPSPSVFPKATLCRSTMTSRSFSFSSSLMPRLFTEKSGQSSMAGLMSRQYVPRGSYPFLGHWTTSTLLQNQLLSPSKSIYPSPCGL